MSDGELAIFLVVLGLFLGVLKASCPKPSTLNPNLRPLDFRPVLGGLGGYSSNLRVQPTERLESGVWVEALGFKGFFVLKSARAL